jgi:hypothetical protein
MVLLNSEQFIFLVIVNVVACRPLARQRPLNRQTTAVTGQRPVNSNRGTVFSCGPCRDVISRILIVEISQVSQWSGVSEFVGW